MLSLLHIENVAVIEKVDIEFPRGFNVLTGETGAGKSILIDALGAITGGRSSRDIIRSGAGSASISAVFCDISGSVAVALGDEGAAPDEDGLLVIRRDIFLDGRNSCRVNGSPLSVASLRNIGALLVNIHGQHDNQRILDPKYHLEYLDGFAGDGDGLAAYSLCFDRFKSLSEEIASLKIEESEKERALDVLSFRIDEIEGAALRPHEDEELGEAREILKNAGRITEAVEGAFAYIYGDEDRDGACAMIDGASRFMEGAAEIAESLEKAYARLRELSCAAADIADDLRSLRDSLDFSPGELDRVEERIDVIYRLKRKYGGSIEEILQNLKKYQDEYDRIAFASDRVEKLTDELSAAGEELRREAERLSRGRREAALKLEALVMDELSGLDMGKVRFSVEILTDYDNFDRTGADRVQFLIATNPGDAPRPIRGVASGGELARIMLALKNVMSGADAAGTLVFDEVDSGVSGRAAQRVAEKLYSVSRGRQVICVSHLPQIAAMADAHFLIEKSERGGRSVTEVTALDYDGRRREIARITGGIEITAINLENAGELMEQASGYKKQEKGTEQVDRV